MSTTTVALSPQLHARIKAMARARSASMNEIVNTAIAHWLAAKKLIRLL
jgi:predicted transcriptional regulator